MVFVGYQAEGTLGRVIEDGAKKVKILGDEIGVLAEIHSIEGFSGHADRDGLLEWLSAFTKKPRKVFIVHGEKDSATDFATSVKQKLDMETIVPRMGETVEIGLGRDVITVKKDLKAPAQGDEKLQASDVTLKIMQIKVQFMEAMDSLNRSVASGELDVDAAEKILDGIQRAIDEEKAG